jgi:hypothetical protein
VGSAEPSGNLGNTGDALFGHGEGYLCTNSGIKKVPQKGAGSIYFDLPQKGAGSIYFDQYLLPAGTAGRWHWNSHEWNHEK